MTPQCSAKNVGRSELLVGLEMALKLSVRDYFAAAFEDLPFFPFSNFQNVPPLRRCTAIVDLRIELVSRGGTSEWSGLLHGG
jgi:hypothetical protein